MFEKEAEEWAIDNVCKDCSRYEKCMGKEQCTCKDCSKEKWQNGAEFGFQKGIKAKVNITTISDCPIKTQWHNLQENPEDLPEESIPVLALCSDGSFDECDYIPCEGFKDTVFSTWYYPIAWIEKEKVFPKM